MSSLEQITLLSVEVEPSSMVISTTLCVSALHLVLPNIQILTDLVSHIAVDRLTQPNESRLRTSYVLAGSLS